MNPSQQRGTAKAGGGNCRESICCLLAWGSPRSSAHATVPAELLTPLCLFPKAQEKDPDLEHGSGHPHHCGSGILRCHSAHWDTRGHQQAPSSGHPLETKG